MATHVINSEKDWQCENCLTINQNTIYKCPNCKCINPLHSNDYILKKEPVTHTKKLERKPSDKNFDSKKRYECICSTSNDESIYKNGFCKVCKSPFDKKHSDTLKKNSKIIGHGPTNNENVLQESNFTFAGTIKDSHQVYLKYHF